MHLQPSLCTASSWMIVTFDMFFFCPLCQPGSSCQSIALHVVNLTDAGICCQALECVFSALASGSQMVLLAAPLSCCVLVLLGSGVASPVAIFFPYVRFVRSCMNVRKCSQILYALADTFLINVSEGKKRCLS